MRRLLKLGTLGLAAYGAATLYDRYRGGTTGAPGAPAARPPGRDTATGTDPSAKYERPGYEDKSFGQAGNQDQALADRLVGETGGDLEAADRRFREEAAGAPALARQEREGTGRTPAGGPGPT